MDERLPLIEIYLKIYWNIKNIEIYLESLTLQTFLHDFSNRCQKQIWRTLSVVASVKCFLISMTKAFLFSKFVHVTSKIDLVFDKVSLACYQISFIKPLIVDDSEWYIYIYIYIYIYLYIYIYKERFVANWMLVKFCMQTRFLRMNSYRSFPGIEHLTHTAVMKHGWKIAIDWRRLGQYP